MTKVFTIEDQLKLENSYKEFARELFITKHKEQEEKGQASKTAVGTRLLKYVGQDLAKAVSAWLTEEIKPKRGVQKEHKKLLSALVEALGYDLVLQNACAFVFEKIINSVSRIKAPQKTISNVAIEVGRALYYECKLEAYLQFQESRDLKKRVIAEVDKRNDFRYKWNVIEEISGQDTQFKFYKATDREMLSLGNALVILLVENTDLVTLSTRGTKGLIYLEPTDFFIELWEKNIDNLASKVNINAPTIVPPKKWTSIYDGAYYSHPEDLMRIHWTKKRARTTRDYLRKLQEVDLSEIMHAVNRIQETAYCINTEVLNVVNHLVAIGGDRAGLERTEPYEQLPYLEGETNADVIRAHKKRMKEIIQKEIARKSKALRMYKTIGTAKDFAKYPKIYFPCNIDFRGRVYPIPFFSHQGDDLMKSLLLYAEPTPAKHEEDLDTFKIQGSNLWGNDKIGYKAQCEWIDENSEHILRSAEEPLAYTWWEQADEPLQFLAFCLEWKRYIDYRKKYPSIIGFTCRIPIAFDGTCSGLQHYSAMLQDPIGGNAVNLTCGNKKPNDIYQEVADGVIKLVQDDLVNGTADEPFKVDKRYKTKEDTEEGIEEYEGIKYGTKTLAQLWTNHGITRKVCKRPVMTLAYGSGRYGFSEQILEDTCKDNPIFSGCTAPASRYLAEKISLVVKDVVVSAVKGMDFLKKLAKAMAEADLPVSWWTPLGLPVQQQYIKQEQQVLRTRLGAKQIRLYYTTPATDEAVDKNSQRNGVAPNFIHSLDSTHLMMVVNSAGLNNYTTIHDSFGTSLGETKELKAILREQLYKLYTEYTPLETFKEYVEAELHKKLDDVKLPKKGSLSLGDILKSEYVFH
ncbi:DNA-directed RNA polymerase [uncultured Veillonella sp.]|uniref:DNA-directed RNA polymerase n=1 Tax=uncultured Veillonella sp. TaxID=159268 RepID=UPI0025CD9F27|nr:DNA-directed RNA polymerase [uncultured Veillonella sp.]